MAQRWIATRPGDLSVFSLEDYNVPVPRNGEVTIKVRAAGMNPADAKHVARVKDEDFPRPLGYEVAGDGWAHLAVTSTVWLVVPMVFAVVNVLRSEVK